MKHSLILAVGVTTILSASPGRAQDPHEHGAPDSARIGTVHFATSCDAATQPDFDRAVALLHSFWFGASIDGFQGVLSEDPGCAMAWWGIAMAEWGNPFGGIRSTAALERGAAAVQKAELERLRQVLEGRDDDYWAGQVEIQRRVASAWLAQAEGREEEAVELLRSAADMEDGTEKSAITPGPLAPARELLGEMLVEQDRPEDALVEFEASLQSGPDRFRSLYGAARAAELGGDLQKTRLHYDESRRLCQGGDGPERDELVTARAYLGR